MINVKCGIHKCNMEWQGGGGGTNPIYSSEFAPESYQIYTCPECQHVIEDKPEDAQIVRAIILKRDQKWKVAVVKLQFINGVWWFVDDCCELAASYEVIYWEYIK